MKHTNSIFSQLLAYIPKHQFNRVVERYCGDKKVRSLPCWTQFCIMLYGQFSSQRSLRSMISTWESHNNLHYHLGAHSVKRSTLAVANSKRPVGMYLEIFYLLLEQVRGSKVKARDAVRLIDSTTIDLCKTNFKWATFRRGKSGVKMHTVYDPRAKVPTYFSITTAHKHDKKEAENMPLLDNATYVFDRAYNTYRWYQAMSQRGIRFVGRMKIGTKYNVIKTLEAAGEGVLEDQHIQLSSLVGKTDCPTVLRRIRFNRKEDGKTLTFITNDLKRTAGEIAALYKERWEIELFFKWIKQNLKIKTFVGTSENAVKIQIIIAMITYLLMKLAANSLSQNISMQMFAALLRTNIMMRRKLNEIMGYPPGTKTNTYRENLDQLCMAGF